MTLFTTVIAGNNIGGLWGIFLLKSGLTSFNPVLFLGTESLESLLRD